MIAVRSPAAPGRGARAFKSLPSLQAPIRKSAGPSDQLWVRGGRTQTASMCQSGGAARPLGGRVHVRKYHDIRTFGRQAEVVVGRAGAEPASRRNLRLALVELSAHSGHAPAASVRQGSKNTLRQIGTGPAGFGCRGLSSMQPRFSPLQPWKGRERSGSKGDFCGTQDPRIKRSPAYCEIWWSRGESNP